MNVVPLVVVACSLLARILEECSTIHSLLAHFIRWRQLVHTNSTVYAGITPQWLSGLRRLWPNVSRQDTCKLVSGQVPTLCPDSGILSPLRLCWVKGVCEFRCKPPPALLAEWPGSFACHCGNTGVERTPNKSKHTKLSLEKKILPLLLPGFELTTFRSQVRCF